MAGSDDADRLVAVCRECESIYAAKRLGDGRIRPIGSRRGCKRCGATDFAPSPAMHTGAGEESVDAE